MGNAVGEFDVDFPAIIKGVQRAPGRIVAFDRIAKTQTADVEPGVHRGRSFSRCILAAQRDELVLGIDPRH